MQPRWEWLGEDPALDLVNTVKRTGWRQTELLRTPDDLDSWLDAATLPAPRPAAVGEHELQSLLAIRDPALRLFHARVGRGDWRRRDVEAINQKLLEAPDVALLGNEPGTIVRRTLHPNSAMDLLLARLAAAVRDAIQRPDLAFCDAPGCGQFFYRRRNNQAWCGDACGNRARVARHQAG